MEVKQIYNIINSITSEVLGKEGMIQENLDGIVDVGTEMFNQRQVENFMRAVYDRIGKVVFVNRIYKNNAPKVLVDGWEYGSILEKISTEIPEAQENETWELEDGASYDQQIFYGTKVDLKLFNKRATFEVPKSFADRQVKSAFTSAEEINRLFSMIQTSIENSIEIKVESLIMRTINNFTAETIYSLTGGDKTKLQGYNPRVVNLLYMYNTEMAPTTPLTKANCLNSPEFLRYATQVMSEYITYMGKANVNMNMGGKTRFTPKDLLHFVVLSKFASKQSIYLQSDTYHKKLVELPYYEEVSSWQSLGDSTTFAKFETLSKINILTANNHAVEQDGILGVMFDRDALGVSNIERYTTSERNNKAEFTSFWYKYIAGYWNDFNENFVVFLVA